MAGVIFGFWPSSTQNGNTQIRNQTESDSFTYGSAMRVQNPARYQVSCTNWVPRRATMKPVSSGMFAYQITKYCDQNRYIQKIENAKIILPRSCMRDLVISPFNSFELRMTRQMTVVMVTPQRKPPQP